MRRITLERSWRLSPDPLDGALLIQAIRELDERKKRKAQLKARVTTLLGRSSVLMRLILPWLT